jgi:hypothetical protein
MGSQRLRLESASGLDRGINCPSSMVLARDNDEGTRYSHKGDTFHDFAFSVGGGMPREEALAAIPKDDPGRVVCETFPVEHLPVGGSRELAVAYNTVTGKARVLGEGIGRRYEEAGADRSVEVVGSADWAAAAGRVALVVDYKTGWILGRPVESWQLLFLAMTICEVLGLDEARIAYLIPRDGQTPIWRVATLDGLAFASVRNKLAWMRAEAERLQFVPLDRLDFYEGPWCRYCPGRLSCRAKVGAIELLGREALAPRHDSRGAITPEVARAAVLQILRYDEARKIAWRQLAAYAKEYPVDLGNGKKLAWASARESEKVVNPQGAIDHLAERFGVEVARAALSTSKGEIEDAVGGWARAMGHKIGDTVEAVMQELRSIGAVKKLPGKVDARIIDNRSEDTK